MLSGIRKSESKSVGLSSRTGLGLLVILLLSLTLFVSAQGNSPFLREDTPNVLAVAAKIPEADWNNLEAILKREDWGRSAALSKSYLDKLTAENDTGQLARLRYIYLYSLAGKIIGHSFLGEKSAETETRAELEQAARGFIGKDFIFPVRTILADCTGVVNYVCESKDNTGFLRIAATNSNATAIHSFEYIEMSLALNTTIHHKRDVVLGGVLHSVRFNPEESNTWIMILQFESGFVKNIYTKD